MLMCIPARLQSTIWNRDWRMYPIFSFSFKKRFAKSLYWGENVGTAHASAKLAQRVLKGMIEWIRKIWGRYDTAEFFSAPTSLTQNDNLTIFGFSFQEISRNRELLVIVGSILKLIEPSRKWLRAEFSSARLFWEVGLIANAMSFEHWADLIVIWCVRVHCFGLKMLKFGFSSSY